MTEQLNHWTVTLEEDPATGDLMMPIPTDALNQLGWDFGDTLIWDVQEDGRIFLTKKDEQAQPKS
jgi:hypothetical protein